MSLPFTPSKNGKKLTGSEGSTGDLQSQFAELQKRLKRMPHTAVSDSPLQNKVSRTNALHEDQSESGSESDDEDDPKRGERQEGEQEMSIIRRRGTRGPKELASPNSPKRVDFLSDLSDGLLVESRRLAYENKQFKTQVEILKEERDKFKNQASNLGLLNTKLSEKESQSSDHIWELETKLAESKDKLEKALIDLERVGKAKSSLEAQMQDSTATVESVRAQKIQLEKDANEKINILKKQANVLRQRNSDLNDENDALQKEVSNLKMKAGTTVQSVSFKDALADLGDNFEEETENDVSMLVEPEPAQLNANLENTKELERETLKTNLSHAIMTISRLRKYIQKQKTLRSKALASPTLKTLAMSSPMASSPLRSRTQGSPSGLASTSKSSSVRRKLFQSRSGSSSPTKENQSSSERGENLEKDWENFEDTSIATGTAGVGKLGNIPALVKNDSSEEEEEEEAEEIHDENDENVDVVDEEDTQQQLRSGQKALADELKEPDVSQRDFDSSPSKRAAKKSATFGSWGIIAIPHGQSLDSIGEFDMVPFARGDYERLLKEQKRKAEKAVKISLSNNKIVQGLRLVTSPEYKKLKKDLEATTNELQRAKNKADDVRFTSDVETESQDTKKHEGQIADLRRQLIAKCTEVKELKAKLEDVQREAAQTLEAQLSKKLDEKDELRRKLEKTHKVAIENLEEKLSRTEAQKEDLRKKLEYSEKYAALTLQENLSNGETEKDALKKRLEDAQKRSKLTLDKRLSDKDAEIKALQKTLDDLEKDSAVTLQKKLAEKKIETEDLKNDLETTHKQALDTLKKELSDKVAEIVELKKRLEVSENLQETLAGKETEMRNLKEKLETSQKDVVEKASAVLTLQDEVEGLKTKISKLQDEVKTGEAEVARLWNLIGESKKETTANRDKLLEKLASTERELSIIKNKYENPEESYLTSKASILGFSTLSFDEQKKLRNDSKGKIALEKVKKSLETQIGELKEKATLSDKRLSEANKKHDDLSNKLKMLQEVHNAPSAQYLKEKAASLQLVAISKLEYDNQKEELENTRTKLGDNEKICSNLKNEVEQVKAESDQLKKQYSEIEKKIALKADAFDESQKQLSAVSNTLSEREVKIVTLQSDLDERQKEIDALQQKLSGLEERSTALKDELMRLKHSHERKDSSYIKQQADAPGLGLIRRVTTSDSKFEESDFEDASEIPIIAPSEKSASPRRSNSLNKTFSRSASVSNSRKLQQQLKETQDKLTGLQKKLDKPTPEYIQSKCEFVGIANVSTGDLSKLKLSISALKDQLQKKEEKLNSLKQTHSQEAVLLKKLLEEKQSELSQLKSTQGAELEKLKTSISQSSTELELKKSQLEAKITELATLKAELQGKSCDLESISSKLTKSMDALKEKTAQLEELTGEHQKLRVKLEKLESDYEAEHQILEKPDKKFLEEKADLLGFSLVAVTEHSAVVKKAEEKESAVEQLNIAITRLNQEYSTAKADIGTARGEIEDLKKELQEAHISLQKMEKENATNEQLLTVKANRITALNQDLEKKNSETLAQSKELELLKSQLKSIETEKLSLQEKYVSLNKSTPQTNEAEKSSLQEKDVLLNKAIPQINETEKSGLQKKDVSLNKAISSIPSGSVAVDVGRYKKLLDAMSVLDVRFKKYAENLGHNEVDSEELKREVLELESAAEKQAKLLSKYESPSFEYLEDKATELGMKVLTVSEYLRLYQSKTEKDDDQEKADDQASTVSEEVINEDNICLSGKIKNSTEEVEALQADLRKKETTLKKLERRVEGTLDPDQVKDKDIQSAESGSVPFVKISKLRKLLEVKHQEISTTEQKIIKSDNELSRVRKEGKLLSMNEINAVDDQLDQKKGELEENKKTLTEKVRNLEIQIQRKQEEMKGNKEVKMDESLTDKLDSVRAELKAKSNALDVLERYITSNRKDATRARLGTDELQVEVAQLRVELKRQKQDYNSIEEQLDEAIKFYEPELERRNQEIGHLKEQLKVKATELQELEAQEKATKKQEEPAEKVALKTGHDASKEQVGKDLLQNNNTEKVVGNASSSRTITSKELATKAAEYNLALISEQELAELRQRSPTTVENIRAAASKMNLLCIPEVNFVATTLCRKPDPANSVVVPLSYYLKLTKTHEWYKANRDSVAEWQESEREKSRNKSGISGKKSDDDRSSLASLGSLSISSSLAVKRGSLGQPTSSQRAAAKKRSQRSQQPPVNSPAFALSQLAKQDAGDSESRLGINSLHTVNTVISTRHEMVAAITQTIIGEYLFKYYRKLGPFVLSVSGSRHERYFWIHPYSLTLYWSTSNPSLSDPSANKIHALAISKVKVVEDNNPLPPGLYHKSIIVYSNDSHSIKITCPTRQRHNIWYNSLHYLIVKSLGGSASDDNIENTENQYNENFSLDERLELERSQSFRHQQPRASILRSGRMPRSANKASVSETSSILRRQRSSFPSMNSIKRHLTIHKH